MKKQLLIIPSIIFILILLTFFYLLFIERNPSELPSNLLNKNIPKFETESLLKQEKFTSSNEFGNEIEIIGIQMIGIDNINDGLKFAQKLNLSYKLGYNSDNSTIKKYNINSFPTTIFVSKSNNNFIIWDGYIGYDDLLNNTKNILKRANDK